MSKKKITVSDSMGTVEIPADALYQAQTQRALDNFKISPLRLPNAVIHALALIKKACAETNFELGKLDQPRRRAGLRVSPDGHHRRLRRPRFAAVGRRLEANNPQAVRMESSARDRHANRHGVWPRVVRALASATRQHVAAAGV